MVNYSQIVAFAFPLAITVTDYYFSDGKLAFWRTEKLGPEPVWDETTQTYPSLEVHRADCETKFQNISNLQNKINSGYTHITNVVYALRKSDRNIFTSMLTLVKEALDLGLITNDTVQSIADINGTIHSISTLEFRQLMVAYGNYYKSIWDEAKSLGIDI